MQSVWWVPVKPVKCDIAASRLSRLAIAAARLPLSTMSFKPAGAVRTKSNRMSPVAARLCTHSEKVNIALSRLAFSCVPLHFKKGEVT